jgi:hypothetical protein
MITKYLEVGDNDWGVLVTYDFDYLDYDDIASMLKAFGMKERNIRKSLRILSKPNTGMAVSVPDLKMSAIYISQSTSPSEFYSTAIHECIHVADSILDWYGESWHGESSAYLVGFMTKEIVEMIGEPCIN